MVGPWQHQPYTFRALSKTYGQMWLRCDVCRYARLKLAGLRGRLPDQDFQLLSVRFWGPLQSGRADQGIRNARLPPRRAANSLSVTPTPSSDWPNCRSTRWPAVAESFQAARSMDGA